MPANPMPFATSCEESGRPRWTPTSSPPTLRIRRYVPSYREVAVDRSSFAYSGEPKATYRSTSSCATSEVRTSRLRASAFRDSAMSGGTKIEDKPELVELEGEESPGAPKRGAPGREVSGAVDRSPLGFGWGRRTRSDVYGVATRFSVPRVVSSAMTLGSARARAASRSAWIRVKTHCRLSRGWTGISGPADRRSRARVAPDASGHVIRRSNESFEVPRILAITNASPPCQTT